MTPTQRARRERILNVTRDHLARYGFDALNMRDLAFAADVSPTTLYRLFESKEGLILATIIDQINESTLDARNNSTPGLDRLYRLLAAFAKILRGQPRAGEAVTKLLFSADPGGPITEALLANAMRARRASAEEMQAAGQIGRRIDVDLLARQLVIATWGPLLLWIKGFTLVRNLESELLGAATMALLPVATPEGRAQLQKLAKKSPALKPIFLHLNALR
jgi:AcrR family transcriptional regulator